MTEHHVKSAPEQPDPPEPVPVLSYGRPEPKRPELCAKSLSRALLVAVILDFLIIVLFGTTLDSGVTARRFALVMLAFWIITAIVFFRRRWNPTWLDLAWVVGGYPLMVGICEWAVSR